MTDSYYSPWIGSNIVWAPNAMVVAPMPRPSGQWRRLGEHQLVTAFTPWRDGIVSDRPEPFALINWRREGTMSDAESKRLSLHMTMPNASNVSSNIYGYRAGDTPTPIIRSYTTRNGAEYRSPMVAAPMNTGQNVGNYFWDDRDLMEAPATTEAPNYGYVAPAPAETGYVKPNINGSFNPGTTFRDRDGRTFEAKPDKKDEINYGHSDVYGSSDYYGYQEPESRNNSTETRTEKGPQQLKRNGSMNGENEEYHPFEKYEHEK